LPAPLQELPVILHTPGMVGQLPLEVQLVEVWTLQVPAMVGQLPLDVHTVPVWTLQ